MCQAFDEFWTLKSMNTKFLYMLCQDQENFTLLIKGFQSSVNGQLCYCDCDYFDNFLKTSGAIFSKQCMQWVICVKKKNTLNGEITEKVPYSLMVRATGVRFHNLVNHCIISTSRTIYLNLIGLSMIILETSTCRRICGALTRGHLNQCLI